MSNIEPCKDCESISGCICGRLPQKPQKLKLPTERELFQKDTEIWGTTPALNFHNR